MAGPNASGRFCCGPTFRPCPVRTNCKVQCSSRNFRTHAPKHKIIIAKRAMTEASGVATAFSILAVRSTRRPAKTVTTSWPRKTFVGASVNVKLPSLVVKF